VDNNALDNNPLMWRELPEGIRNRWYSPSVAAVPFEATATLYRDVCARGMDAVRWLALRDRYFLLTCVMGHAYAANRWVFDRCREIDADPDGNLDLWSRFHFKSTIITLAGSVQEILRDPEITIGILSYNKPLSHKFVDQIRKELEKPTLYALFPDILHAKPPRLNWSTQNGITVKRKGNPKEPTVCGSGLVDGQPTGMHFRLRIYDDVVVKESVSSPEQIAKTTAAWELSLALGVAEGGREWYAGTRYHTSDTYSVMLARGAVKPRIRLCVDARGEPTLMTPAALAELRGKMGSSTWAAQMMQNPLGDGNKTFNDDWWNVYFTRPAAGQMRVAVIIDSANAKKKTSDYTTMWVVGLCADGNYYLLDGVHDRLDLSERTDALFKLVKEWRPECVFWEQVGCQCDAEHVRLEQDNRAWHFRIEELTQHVAKNDRIRWLEPTFRSGRIWLPVRMMKRQADGTDRDLMGDLYRDEYQTHPVCRHDDMLDDLANIHHPRFNEIMDFPRGPERGFGIQPRGTIPPSKDAWNPLSRWRQ